MGLDPATLLVELRCEELPPALLYRLAHDLSCGLAEKLQKNGLLATKGDYKQAREDFVDGHEKDDYNERMKRDYGFVNYPTPRRIAMLFNDVEPASPPSEYEKRGPSFDCQQNALVGFLRANKASEKSLSIMDYRGSPYHCLVIKNRSRKLAEILGELIEQTIKDVSAPRMMRWGENDWQFVRPIKGWCIVHGIEKISTKIFDARSTGSTYGHRFLDPGEIVIEGKRAEQYVKLLKQHKVLVNPVECRTRIRQLVGEIESNLGNAKVKLGKLDDDNVKMCEWPTPYCVSFGKKYLDLPSEVLELCVKKHLRSYMVTEINSQKLNPDVVFVADNDFSSASKSKYHVLGVERVLQARLADSLYSYECDSEFNEEDMKRNLRGITYLKEFGTMFDRSKRLEELFGKEGIDQRYNEYARAIRYCQYDMGTQLHGEYPDLEGILAAHYLLKKGQINGKCASLIVKSKQAINNEDRSLNLLILCDEIERLTAFASLNLLPRGSSDPHGLRQSAVRILEIGVQDKELPFTFLINQAIRLLHGAGNINNNLNIDRLDIITMLHKFVLNRAHHYLNNADEGHLKITQRHCKAVNNSISLDAYKNIDFNRIPLSSPSLDFVLSALERIKALAMLEMKNPAEYQDILDLHKRLDNIVGDIMESAENRAFNLIADGVLDEQTSEDSPKESMYLIGTNLELDKFRKTIEILFNQYDSLLINSTNLVEFLLKYLHLLGPEINSYLEKVRINVDDKEERARRLKPLRRASKILNRIVDFRQLYS